MVEKTVIASVKIEPIIAERFFLKIHRISIEKNAIQSTQEMTAQIKTSFIFENADLTQKHALNVVLAK